MILWKHVPTESGTRSSLETRTGHQEARLISESDKQHEAGRNSWIGENWFLATLQSGIGMTSFNGFYVGCSAAPASVLHEASHSGTTVALVIATSAC